MGGIFASVGRELWEHGFNVLPVEGKQTRIKNWTKFNNERQTENEIDSLVENFPNANIAIPCGPVNGIWFLDFDFAGEGAEHFEQAIRGLLPKSPIERFGSKGFAAAYKWTGRQFPFKKLYRGSYVFCEIIDDKRYIVIPPSIHPVTKEPYKWSSRFDLTSDIVDDIPEVDEQIFEKIRLLSKSKMFPTESKKAMGRHDFLFGYALKIADAVSSFDELVSAVVKFDAKVNTKKPYFKDTHYFKTDSVHENAAKDCAKWMRWLRGKRKELGQDWEIGQAVDDEGPSPASYEAFELFFERNFGGGKRDLFNGVFYVPDSRSNWTPLVNRIKTVRSLAQSQGLSKQHTEDHFERWVENKRRELLIEIPDWNGHDIIGEIVSHLKFRHFETDDAVNIFKGFVANMWRKAHDPNIQNRVLILNGAQGIGKDELIKNLFNNLAGYFGDYVATPNERDFFMSTISKILLNISEFDRMLEMNTASLKTVITTTKFTMRLPYQRENQDFFQHASFIASTNVNELFRDHTGNRRFIVMDVDKIDWSYPKGMSGQVLAQGVHLAKQKFDVEQKVNEAIAKVMERYLMDDPNELLVAVFDKYFMQQTKIYGGRQKLSLQETMPVLEKVKRFFPHWSLQTIQYKLGTMGRKIKTNRGAFYSTSGSSLGDDGTAFQGDDWNNVLDYLGERGE